jgi:hypothetical protein
VSERNVHSSLVYQGVVGDLGIEEVAQMNAAAMIPDLCIWVDCDPKMALNRISDGTLKLSISSRTDDTEYFETDEYQVRIRQGYHDLLGGAVPMPAPFDAGRVVGPIINDGTKEQFRRKLQIEIRKFLHERPRPLNVPREEVEIHMLSEAMTSQKGQTTLDVLATKPARSNDDWLGGEKPWEVVRDASKLYAEAVDASDAPPRMDVPQDPLSHSVLSILGTLSLLPATEISDLRHWLGPVRMVTERHTHRMVKFFDEQSDWVRVHRPLIGHDASRTELRSDWQSFGRVGLAIWPFKEVLSEWKRGHPGTSWKHGLSAVMGTNPTLADSCVERLGILGSGKANVAPPTTRDELLSWWQFGAE